MEGVGGRKMCSSISKMTAMATMDIELLFSSLDTTGVRPINRETKAHTCPEPGCCSAAVCDRDLHSQAMETSKASCNFASLEIIIQLQRAK